jgi:hypothetical protein
MSNRYVTVPIKNKAGKVIRRQRAMVLASGQYKFVKNSGATAHHTKKKGHTHVAKSKKRKHSSKAMTVYRPAPVVKVIRVGGGGGHKKKKTHHVRGGGRHLMLREHGAGEIQPGPFRIKSMVVAAAIGKSKSTNPGSLAMLPEWIDKLPSVGGVPKEFIAGLILNKFADRGDWYDGAAQAMLDISAYEFGKNDFKMGEDDE